MEIAEGIALFVGRIANESQVVNANKQTYTITTINQSTFACS